MLARFSSSALIALAVAVSGAVQAQSFLEGWEPGPATPGVGPIPATWTSVNDSPGGPGTNPNWQVVNSGGVFAPFSGATYAFANYNSSTGANDISNYLISPLVTFNNGDTITFYTRTVDFPAFPDRLELVYNTTGSTLPADFTNVLLTVNPTLTTAGYPTTWTQFSATITGLAGATAGRFAFHYNPTTGGPSGTNSDYIGIDEVNYLATGSTLATNTSLGFGCGGSAMGDGTFYELFDGATSINDLANTSYTLNWTGTGYAVIPGASALVPPVGAAIASGDDMIHALALPFAFPCPQGNITQAWLCSNGFLSFVTTANADYTESVAELLTGGTRLAFMWDDLNLTTTGFNAELDGSGVYQITFTNVPQYGGTDQNNVQVSLWPNGNIELKYGSMALLDCLVGLSTGVAATDPGNTDLTTALPIVITTGQYVPALALTGVTRPVTGTSWNLNTENIPDIGGLHINLELLGLADPNIPDLFFLGAPGCGLRGTFDFIGGPAVTGSSTQGRSLAIPASASLIGAEVFATSMAFATPGTNALGLITSNTIKGTVGDV